MVLQEEKMSMTECAPVAKRLTISQRKIAVRRANIKKCVESGEQRGNILDRILLGGRLVSTGVGFVEECLGSSSQW